MPDKVFPNNQVDISGKVISGFTFSHEVYGEKFYTCEISVPRLSDTYDIIPLLVSERIVDVTRDLKGSCVSASGQFRSYNRHDVSKNRLILSVFVREMKVIGEEEAAEEQKKPNQIFLDGYICKPPVYRNTPLGREIADMLLAVNRPYGKSDYIPCICWGRNARYARTFEVGSRVQAQGRIQSREYQKKTGEDEFEKRIAYEVSVSKIERVEPEVTEG